MQKIAITKDLPKGISILCVFYAINAFLFLISTLIFFRYLDIIVCGKTASMLVAIFIRLILIILPLFLTLGLYYLKKEAYFLAIIYHLFFMMNGLTTMSYLLNKNLKLKPFLEIVLKPEYQTTRVTDLFGTPFQVYAIQIISILVGIAIIVYLFKRRKIFAI